MTFLWKLYIQQLVKLNDLFQTWLIYVSIQVELLPPIKGILSSAARFCILVLAPVRRLENKEYQEVVFPSPNLVFHCPAFIKLSSVCPETYSTS